MSKHQSLDKHVKQNITWVKTLPGVSKVVIGGPMQVTANTEHPVYFPPLLGGLLVAGGIVVLIVGRMNKK
jgi:hypothetical protein